MVATVNAKADKAGVGALPLVPKNPLPIRQQLTALRVFHTGQQTLRDAGGPVTRLSFGPNWLLPPIVIATTPQGARDILGRPDALVERNKVHQEMRHLLGPNLFVVTHDAWLPRRRALQPVFTKHRVRDFGGQMSSAADTIANSWADGGEIDLDTECRRLTLRALGRSVLGLDLDERADALAEPLRTVLTYIADRGLAPIRAPKWLPTPPRRRARAAAAIIRQIANDALQACRADPTRDAPLVHALIAATDPATGRPLTDDEICDDLVVFIGAGHDTTATTVAYALWALGCHREIQDRVAAEAAAIGDRELTPEDVPHLGYTVAVLHEAMRLCPPAAAIGRLATQDIIVDGYRVQAGTMVVVGTYAIHRDPALWDHPLLFDPDRFSPQNSTGRDRWQFIPFGAGPRSCIGDHFAMLEATLALATIVRRTEILSMDPDFPVAVPLTMVADAPIRARTRARTWVCEHPRHSRPPAARMSRQRVR